MYPNIITTMEYTATVFENTLSQLQALSKLPLTENSLEEKLFQQALLEDISRLFRTRRLTDAFLLGVQQEIREFRPSRTPRDLENFEIWKSCFKDCHKIQSPNEILIMLDVIKYYQYCRDNNCLTSEIIQNLADRALNAKGLGTFQCPF